MMQGDCNLVVYEHYNRAIWASNTKGAGSGCYAAMQWDGNLVVYDYAGRAVWATGTELSGAATLVDAYVAMQDDNNLVLYKNERNKCPFGWTDPNLVSGAPNPLIGPAWSSRGGRQPRYPGGQSEWSNSCLPSGTACSGGAIICVPDGAGFSCGYCP